MEVAYFQEHHGTSSATIVNTLDPEPWPLDPAHQSRLLAAQPIVDLPVVFERNANETEDIGKPAPEAGFC
jgi:hypothetical protein